MSFDVQYRAVLRPSHTTTETAKKKIRYRSYTLQLFFTTTAIRSKVLYVDNDFHNNLFLKNLCKNRCSVSGPLASVFLESR